jgi:methylation protein EvaC
MTLLAYCGVGPDRLPFLVDKNPFKQGLLTPGHHIPVCPPDRLLRDRPEVVLLLAWNFAAEVFAQQAEFGRRGGKWLMPLPAAHYWPTPSRGQKAEGRRQKAAG